MKVLHIDTGKEWRGGQRQAYLLHTGLLDKNINSILISNDRGVLAQKKCPSHYPMTYHNELDPLFMINLSKIIKNEKPDIIHAHDAHSLTPAIILKLLHNNLKLVHTRRVAFTIKKSIFSKWKYTNKNITKLVAVSNGIKDALVSDGVDSKQIEVIHSGVSFQKSPDLTTISDIRNKFKLQNSYIIGCVANFTKEKDHETLITAFKYIHEEMQNTKLLLVGDGPLLDNMKILAEKLNVTNHIIFTGYNENANDFISIMDIFMLTSTSEGLGTVIIDAMYLKKPVVASNVGGIPELVIEDTTGYLCEVGNPKYFANQVLKLIKNNKIYDKISQNAYTHSLNFSSEKMLKNYIDLYNTIN